MHITTTSIDVLELDGKDVVIGEDITLIVKSVWHYKQKRVLLKFGKTEVVVSAGELELAIRSCTL